MIGKNKDGIEEKRVTKNIELLKIALNENPREVKRFLNMFVISNEIYFEENERKTLILLSIQVFKWKWPETYRSYSQNQTLRDY